MSRELENEVLVYAFEKNKAAEVRARLYSFEGHRLADIRIFARSRDDKAVKVPTSKGFAVRLEQLPALREAVEALMEEVERERSG
jgi:hypothetical protein